MLSLWRPAPCVTQMRSPCQLAVCRPCIINDFIDSPNLRAFQGLSQTCFPILKTSHRSCHGSKTMKLPHLWSNPPCRHLSWIHRRCQPAHGISWIRLLPRCGMHSTDCCKLLMRLNLRLFSFKVDWSSPIFSLRLTFLIVPLLAYHMLMGCAAQDEDTFSRTHPVKFILAKLMAHYR